MIGQTLNNRYKVTARLGKGAMGTVYRATDSQTSQEVALKVISSELALDPAMLERFKREGESLRALKHVNIVGYLDAFEHDEHNVIVMEYVGGGSLHDLMKSGALPIERASQITLDLCDALIRSHKLNIIHRDIKPENVLITEEGTPKLADFGVARLSENTRMTRTGTKVGTPYYMAPEAWKGETLNPQADIWSLGVMLFEMLAGQVPFDGDSEFAVMTKVCTMPPPDLKKLRRDVPPGLVNIVTRMLTRDLDQRYQTMRQVAVDLESGGSATTPQTVKAKPSPKKKENKSPAAFNKNIIWIAGIVVLVLGFGLWSIKSEGAQSSQPTAATTQLPTSARIPFTQTAQLTKTPIPAPVLAIGSTDVSLKDGATLMYVPAGEFTMGSDAGESDEKPIHKVNLDAFWIDQTEVTNAMYAKCVSDGLCKKPSNTNSDTHSSYYGNSDFDNYPVVYVDWNMAIAYCAWADRRLPTEAEWEKAARSESAFVYPWGNDAPNNNLLNYNLAVGDTTKVNSYESGKSIYGAYDMAGNVWEWVSSLYRPYPYDAKDGRENMSSTNVRVLRGGSWSDLNDFVRSALRNDDDPTSSDSNIGFRCSRSHP